jgi:hypothetical protein
MWTVLEQAVRHAHKAFNRVLIHAAQACLRTRIQPCTVLERCKVSTRRCATSCTKHVLKHVLNNALHHVLGNFVWYVCRQSGIENV